MSNSKKFHDGHGNEGGGGGPARGGPVAKVTLTSLPPELLVRIVLWFLWDSATATLLSPPQKRLSDGLHMVAAVCTYFREVVFQTGIRWRKSFTTWDALVIECTNPLLFSNLVRGGFPPLSIDVRGIFDTLDTHPWVIPDAVVSALQTLAWRTGREVRVSFTLLTRQSTPTLIVLAFRVLPVPGDRKNFSVVFFPEPLSVDACERCGQRLSDPWAGTRQCESTRTCRICPVCTGPSPPELVLCKNPSCLCGGKLKLCPKHFQGCEHGCKGVYVTPHARAGDPLSVSQLHRCDADVCTARVCDAPHHVPVDALRASEWISKGMQGQRPQRLCPQHLARCATCGSKGYAPLMEKCGNAACDQKVCKACRKDCESCGGVFCEKCATVNAQDGSGAAPVLCQECKTCRMPKCDSDATNIVVCGGCHSVPLCSAHYAAGPPVSHDALFFCCVKSTEGVPNACSVFCVQCVATGDYGGATPDGFVCKRHSKVCPSCYNRNYCGTECAYCPSDVYRARYCDGCALRCSREGCEKSVCGRHSDVCRHCKQRLCDTSSYDSCFRSHACSASKKRSFDGSSDGNPQNRFAGYNGKKPAAGAPGDSASGGMA